MKVAAEFKHFFRIFIICSASARMLTYAIHQIIDEKKNPETLPPQREDCKFDHFEPEPAQEQQQPVRE